MRFLLIFLGLYLLGVLISYLIDIKDIDKFNAIVLSLKNQNSDLPDLEPKKIKLAFGFFLLVMALAWPVRLLLFKSKQNEELHSD